MDIEKLNSLNNEIKRAHSWALFCILINSYYTTGNKKWQQH